LPSVCHFGSYKVTSFSFVPPGPMMPEKKRLPRRNVPQGVPAATVGDRKGHFSLWSREEQRAGGVGSVSCGSNDR
jgi:hypothetical protein